MGHAFSIAAVAAIFVARAAAVCAQGIAEPQVEPLVQELQPHWQYQDRPPQFGDPRFAFRGTADGYLRIDIRTGEVASCRKSDGGWDCVAVPGERVVIDTEVARLRRENALLRNTLTERGVPLPAGVGLGSPERTTPEPRPDLPAPAATTVPPAPPQVANLPAPEPPPSPPLPAAPTPPVATTPVPPVSIAPEPAPPTAVHPVPPESRPPKPREPGQASRNDVEIERIMNEMEKAWRRLIELMVAIQRDLRKS
jgi:hypothetical protein